MSAKKQRVRDPVHNLIEFDNNIFDQRMWNILQTRPFQRLRRVRQLGFSEYVYPGATHSRFAHSLGVFETARQLMKIIKKHQNNGSFDENKAQMALAAALVHDVGHGMFSHAFEEVGKKLDLKMAKHENVSGMLIRDSEITKILDQFGSGFANDVAKMVIEQPENLYGAVVSSQFDADRLDYMQRDRMMTGVQNSAIDFKWLLANIEIAEVRQGVDENAAGTIETFVFGPKALFAADTYVLSLFQLYPTVYFHKATRAAEKMFTALMIRIITLVQDGKMKKTGLNKSHPICKFAKKPNDIENALNLDDTVFWGSLPMLALAGDSCIKILAERFQQRYLYKCIDVREQLLTKMKVRPNMENNVRNEKLKKIDQSILLIEKELTAWSEKKSTDQPRIMIDRADRSAYSAISGGKGPWNQMRIKVNGSEMDLADSSAIVKNVESYKIFRAYIDQSDTEAKKQIEDCINTYVAGDANG